MSLNKRSKAGAAVLGAVGLLISSALASDNVVPTVLLPCGKGATDSSHQLVPDGGCQEISDTGAFAITSLGSSDQGIRLGFSATADCMQTYVPSFAELAQLKEGQKCRVYVTDYGHGHNHQPWNWEKPPSKPYDDAHQADSVDWAKAQADKTRGSSDPAGHVQKRAYTEDESSSYGGRLLRKRDDGQGGQKDGPADSGDEGANLPARQPLKYVMLVHA